MNFLVLICFLNYEESYKSINWFLIIYLYNLIIKNKNKSIFFYFSLL